MVRQIASDTKRKNFKYTLPPSSFIGISPVAAGILAEHYHAGGNNMKRRVLRIQYNLQNGCVTDTDRMLLEESLIKAARDAYDFRSGASSNRYSSTLL